MNQAMNPTNSALTAEEIVYPDSDGAPMADNTKQFQYIITIQVGLDSLFAENPTVFVASNLFWYPVEGRPGIRTAPDVMVAFGRPKGHRGSYRQWVEDGMAPQVVFEILSPGNTWREMYDKRKFYERYGVQEYLEYDPDGGSLEIWQREGTLLRPVAHEGKWHSPLLDVTLRLETDGELSVFRPDGRKFLYPVETALLVEQERARADQAEQHAQRLAAKLRELGVDLTALGE